MDVLNLDAEWTKNMYDTTNYNIAYDVIEYDYANDMIIRRYEKESNVDVKCSKAQYDFFVNDYGFTYHSISVQQFGNAFNASSYKGQINILCENGYNESINFIGAFQSNLTFGSGAYQGNLTFGTNAYQAYLNFAENTQLNYNNQTLNSNMEYVSFRTKNITVPDLSTATYIYDGNITEVYQRPDNALKIRYYDNSDVLQIVDIDD